MNRGPTSHAIKSNSETLLFVLLNTSSINGTKFSECVFKLSIFNSFNGLSSSSKATEHILLDVDIANINIFAPSFIKCKLILVRK